MGGMKPPRNFLLAVLCLIGATAINATVINASLAAAEPTVATNGWTNTPNVVEGTVTTRPIDTTTPKPPLGYVEYLPKGYNAADTTTVWPLIVFISGLGEVGDGTDTAANKHQLTTCMTRHGPLYQVTQHNWDFPAVVVAVQSPGYWNNASILASVFTYMQGRYHVDANRIYLTGLCEGAQGVYNFSSQHTGLLAAIMPIECASPPNAGQAAALATMPMWAVQSFNDPLVARTSTIAWVDQSTLTTASETSSSATSDAMATYPGYAGKNYHEAVATTAAGLPVNMFGPTTLVPKATLTNGSTWVSFGSTTFGSATFNSWGGTDALPYAHVTLGDPANVSAKTGIMFRDTATGGATAGAEDVFVGIGSGHQVFFQYRSATGGVTSGSQYAEAGAVDWLKLQKSGNTFTASCSADGVTWTTVGTHTVAFTSATYVGGLAVCPHDNTTTITQTFTNLSIGGATIASLSDADLGAPAHAGSATYAAGTWTVTGGGADIWNAADQCNVASTPLSGDQTIIVKVTGFDNPGLVVSYGKANGLYLTHPYTGPTATQDITITLPIGTNNTAWFNASTGVWTWQPNQTWDQSKPDLHLFTMCWYQVHQQDWVDTYGNGDCWNWLLSQVKAPTGTG